MRHSIRSIRSIAALLALLLVAAACSSGSTDEAADDSTTTAPTTTSDDGVSDDDTAADDSDTDDPEPADDGGDDSTTGVVSDLDTNGDGVVVFGVATPGPRDDGGYYQALIEGLDSFSSERGFDAPIIVDNIEPAQAETEIRNLARQGVDAIAVGAGELSDPLGALAAEFPDIFWYCNCGAGQQIEGVAQSSDDSSEISYSSGYATGLLLQDTDSTNAAFLGCCDLDFEKEAYNAFALGLQAVDPGFTSTYIPTGDFNDVAGATEAFNQAIAAGAGAVYPFLGGSHEPIVQLANDNDIITMSAGTSNACDRGDLDYQIAVQFDAGDYLGVIFEKIDSGELNEGETFVFRVGAFDFVGAKFCDATPDQVAELESVKTQIAAGDFADAFFQIKSDAYGF